MRNLKELSERLRKAAEAIDAIFEVDGTPEIAHKIRQTIKGRNLSIKPKHKLHWTQRPENKAKVRRMAKRASKTRQLKKASNA